MVGDNFGPLKVNCLPVISNENSISVNCLDSILYCGWWARVEVEAALENAIIILLKVREVQDL